MAAPFFEIRNAQVWRGDTLALRNLSLRCFEGEHLAILGPNGSGKSTLLKLITGEVRVAADPDSSCKLFGETLWSIEELRHRIGVVMPEEVARFSPHEITFDVVISSLRGTYGRTRDMRFHRNEKSLTCSCLDRLGISHLAQRPFGSLSSGEKRRTLIARALIHQPSVLVLDEPSTALDCSASLHLTQLLRQLTHQGPTLILVTHHPSEIPPEFERAILLHQGQIFADGPKRKVLNSTNLSNLFQFPLSLKWQNGWCHLQPADFDT